MKALAKILIAAVLLFAALVVVVGPGTVVAGAEYPFGVGPWSSTGRYCHTIYELSRFAAQWKHSDKSTITEQQRTEWNAIQHSLTGSGPQVPRADFTAWYRTHGDVNKTRTGETKLINTWWNQNCTEVLMEAPASVSHAWSGFGSRATFQHYNKNIIQLKNYENVIA